MGNTISATLVGDGHSRRFVQQTGRIEYIVDSFVLAQAARVDASPRRVEVFADEWVIVRNG